MFMRISKLLLGLLLAASLSMQAQISWKYTAVQIDEKDFIVHMQATIDSPWHIYSQYQKEPAIGEPTSVKFVNNPVVKHMDKTSEQGELIKKFNKETGVWEQYYKGNLTLIRPVRLKDTKTPVVLKGVITYQLCTSEKCLPPKQQEFTVILEIEDNS
jgi:hypothetical protein